MRIKTAVTELFGIEHPVVLAPMGGVAGGALAGAVSRAGGLGLIGGGYANHTMGFGEDWIEEQFRLAGNAKVGIGFITWALAERRPALERALARSPGAVMLSFGDAAPFADAIKRAGAKLVLQIQTVADARRAKALGADVIVAQGTEAGGHGASRATFTLVPAVVDAVAPLPVLAAGGIADGRGLAAALMLGAAGVLVGTRFYAATEALGHANAKARIAAASGDDTLRTTVFDQVRGLDWPKPYTGRAIANDFSRRWHGRERELDGALAAETPRYREAASAGQVETSVVFAGEAVDLIHDVAPAADIVARIMAEAARRLGAPLLAAE
jgi:nitronate monooxygenase